VWSNLNGAYAKGHCAAARALMTKVNLGCAESFQIKSKRHVEGIWVRVRVEYLEVINLEVGL
jgi:hypothetical protein